MNRTTVFAYGTPVLCLLGAFFLFGIPEFAIAQSGMLKLDIQHSSTVTLTEGFVERDIAPAHTIFQDGVSNDKILHAGFSFLIFMNVRFPVERITRFDHQTVIPVAAASALFAGILKETIDVFRRNGTGFDWLDLAFDAIGVTAATLLTLILP